jgi:hypothetical protein
VSRKRSRGITDRQRAANQAGKAGVSFKSVGRGLGQKRVKVLSPKNEVDPSCIWVWKDRKREQRNGGRSPIYRMNLRIKSCLKAIWDRLGLEDLGYVDFAFGNGQMGQTISGPPHAFEPYSGLAWYALHIEQRYENCRKQIELNEPERAAYHAFHLGMLFQEFQHMEGAGEFFDQALAIKQAQRDAGKRSMKGTYEARRMAYFNYRDKGDKKTVAAQNAADELGISLGSIINAFGGRLPD